MGEGRANWRGIAHDLNKILAGSWSIYRPARRPTSRQLIAAKDCPILPHFPRTHGDGVEMGQHSGILSRDYGLERGPRELVMNCP